MRIGYTVLGVSNFGATVIILVTNVTHDRAAALGWGIQSLLYARNGIGAILSISNQFVLSAVVVEYLNDCLEINRRFFKRFFMKIES
jgi:hypothetical protein